MGVIFLCSRKSDCASFQMKRLNVSPPSINPASNSNTGTVPAPTLSGFYHGGHRPTANGNAGTVVVDLTDSPPIRTQRSTFIDAENVSGTVKQFFLNHTSNSNARAVVDLTDSPPTRTQRARKRKKPTASRSHVVFVLDMSGSMRTSDVIGEHGRKMRRCDAVFQCCEEVVLEKIHSAAESVCSLILFNIHATVEIRNAPFGAEPPP